MTAVNSSIRKTAVKKGKMRTDMYLPRMAYFIVGFVSARAVWADIPLGFTAVVMIAAEKDRLYKPSLCAGALLSFLLLCTQNVVYTAYVLGCGLYIVFLNTLQKSEPALAVALAVMTAAKLAAGWNVYTPGGKIFVVLEAVAVWTLVSVLENCAEIYNPRSPDISPQDTVLLTAGAVTVTLAFSGGDSHILYIGAAFALALSWLYMGRGAGLYSRIALLCFFVSVADKTAFSIIFMCGMVLWRVGAVCAAKESMVIYPAAALCAAAVNTAFLPQLNGFALTATCLCGLLFYRLLPAVVRLTGEVKPPVYRQGSDYRQLMNDIQKLEESLNYLGSCAVDISRLNEKNLSSPSLEDMVAEEVCRSCSFSAHCWQEKYSFTSQQFSKYGRSLYWQGEKGFDEGFYIQCRNTDRLKKSFEENSRILLSKKYMQQSQKNNRNLLQAAFLSIAGRVGDLLYRNRTNHIVNAAATMKLDRFLSSCGAGHTYCLCTQGPDRAVFALHDPADEAVLYRIHRHIEQIYNAKFTMKPVAKQAVEYIYSFYSTPVYSYEMRHKNRPYAQINGDNGLVLPLADRLYVLLSDGMGTGAAAAAESRTVLAMAKSLLEAGIAAANVINLVNLAMNLRGSGESGATLDLLCINLADGGATLIKAGAASSLHLQGGSLHRYYGDSLPLGVVKDVKTHRTDFTMADGDVVVLATDGAGETGGNVANLYDRPCTEIASYVLNENKINDDKTAIAVRLKKAD